MDKRKTETTPKAKKAPLTEIGKDTGIELTEAELKKAAGGAALKLKNTIKW